MPAPEKAVGETSGVDVAYGSWSCKNALRGAQFGDPDDKTHMFCGLSYALIAIISGWMPMMFIRRVRL